MGIANKYLLCWCLFMTVLEHKPSKGLIKRVISKYTVKYHVIKPYHANTNIISCHGGCNHYSVTIAWPTQRLNNRLI